jgi:hypothetical protein
LESSLKRKLTTITLISTFLLLSILPIVYAGNWSTGPNWSTGSNWIDPNPTSTPSPSPTPTSSPTVGPSAYVLPILTSLANSLYNGIGFLVVVTVAAAAAAIVSTILMIKSGTFDSDPVIGAILICVVTGVVAMIGVLIVYMIANPTSVAQAVLWMWH